MVSAFIIPADDLIKKLAQELKEQNIISPPSYAAWVKTGHFKEDKPLDTDWFYIRSAAVLRKIYIHSATNGAIGIQSLRKKFGRNKNRGSKPDKASRASGSVIRVIVQQLESKGFIEKTETDGRQMSKSGLLFVDNICKGLKEKFPELKAYI
jgi:small subunit ribosomal protein S19e